MLRSIVIDGELVEYELDVVELKIEIMNFSEFCKKFSEEYEWEGKYGMSEMDMNYNYMIMGREYEKYVSDMYRSWLG